MDSFLLQGRDHHAPPEGALIVGARTVACVAAGHGVGKTDVNEDAVCCVDNEALCCAAVADAHWGDGAAFAAIRCAFAQFDRWTREPPTAGVWPGHLETLYRAVASDLAQLEGRSATTFLCCVLDRRDRTLSWLEVGDSFLFHLTSTRCEVWSRRARSWLSRDETPRERVNTRALKQDSRRILLATDGLIEPVYGVAVVTPEDVFAVSGAADLDAAGRALRQEALRRDRSWRGVSGRGGEDNVGFALLEVGGEIGMSQP